MTPMETAEALGHLRDSCGWSVEQIAKSLDMDVEEVENRLALLNLIPKARGSVDRGTLNLANAVLLSRRSPAVQEELYKRACISRTVNFAIWLAKHDPQDASTTVEKLKRAKR